MALLNKHQPVLSAVVLLVMLGSCEFHPGLRGIGYHLCSRDGDCPSKGLVCLEGICVAECPGADPVVWIKSYADDMGIYSCPDPARCEKPDRLEVQLPSGSYVELGPEEMQVDPECELLLARFTLVPMGSGGSAELNVLIVGQDDQGKDVIGVEPEPIELGQEHQDRLYVINPHTFAWPVRIRLMARQSDAEAHFEIEEYRLLCCYQGS